MSKKIEQFNFSKQEDQDNFSKLPQEEQRNHIDDAHEEALRYNNIDNTENFKGAIAEEVPEASESFLNKVKTNRSEYQDKYDERYIDHRERELFQKYCQDQSWDKAKIVVEKTLNPDSKMGRIKRLEELSGKKYEEIDLNLS